MSANNLFQTYEQSLPVERSEAMAFYHRYHLICKTIAERHGYSAMVGAAVFAALSPNNEYHQNIRDMETLLVNEKAGRSVDDFSVTTYGNNKRKAWKIAQGELPSVAITALKTWNFYNNVFTPDDPHYVTVDGHMYWCWQGVPGVVKGLRGAQRSKTGLKGTPSLTKSMYGEIAGDICGLAKAIGIVPCQLQAILWITWKRIHRRAYDSQTSFFPKDFEVAGIINLKSRNEGSRIKLRTLRPFIRPDVNPARNSQPNLKGLRKQDYMSRKPRRAGQ